MGTPAKFGADIQVEPLDSGVPKKFGADVALDAAPAAAPTDTRNGFQKTVDGWSQPGGFLAPNTDPNRSIMDDVANVANRAAQNVAGAVAHPVQAAEGTVDMLKEVTNMDDPNFHGPITQRIKEFRDEYAKDPRLALDNAAGDVAGTYALGKLGSAASDEVLGPTARALKEKAASAREGVRTGTQSLVGAGERPVKVTVAKEADAAKAAREKTIADNKAADEKTLESRGKTDEKNKANAAKDREAEQTNQAERERIAAENRESIRQQEKIAPTKEKLENASSELRARVETAREKASKIGNEKYNGVNETLNPMPADMETVHKLYYEAAESLGEAQAQTPLITRIGKALNSDAEFTYKDEQQLYSELGKELSKGTLPGGVYHAYDLLHEGIGKDMQRIADSQGQGEQLTDARNYWRRMKQTFGKPLAMSDSATAAVKGANAEFMTDDSQANRLRMLGSYDSEIPKLATHIDNLQTGLKSLPNDSPLRSTIKTPTPAPEPTPKVPYGEPNPTKPLETPEVNTRALRENLLDRWTHGESSLNKWQVRALLSGGIGSVVGMLVGHSGGIEAAGAVSAATYAFGPAVVAKILENPAIVEWLTRPPAGELETLQKLPNADRIKIIDGISKLTKAAQRKGINVSPAVAALVGLSAVPNGQKTRQLKQLRDHGRYAQVATHDETGHRIGSNDGETWVDTETGEPVHAQ